MTRLGVFATNGFFEASFSPGAMDALLTDLPATYVEVTQMSELPDSARNVVGRWESEKESGLVYMDGDAADELEPTHIHIIKFV
jgi:hypothetical protein